MSDEKSVTIDVDAPVTLTITISAKSEAPEPEPPEPEPEPEPEPPEPPVDPSGPPDPASGEHPYFDMLSAHPNRHLSAHYRSQANVLYHAKANKKDEVTTSYSVDEDGAKQIIPAGEGSVKGKDQLRAKFPRISTGSFLVYIETMNPDDWVSEEGRPIGGMHNHKAIQLGRGEDGGQLGIEIKYRYSQVGPPYVARVELRDYLKGYKNGPSDTFTPQVGEHWVLPNVWTSHWIRYDCDSGRLDYWAGDDEQGITRIIDGVKPISRDGFGAWEAVWSEFNSSQSRSRPDANVYSRNVVVIKNISLEDTEALVEAR